MRNFTRNFSLNMAKKNVAQIYDRDKLEWKDERDTFKDPYMHEDSKSDDFLESVKQSVPLMDLKKVHRSSYFD